MDIEEMAIILDKKSTYKSYSKQQTYNLKKIAWIPGLNTIIHYWENNIFWRIKTGTNFQGNYLFEFNFYYKLFSVLSKTPSFKIWAQIIILNKICNNTIEIHKILRWFTEAQKTDGTDRIETTGGQRRPIIILLPWKRTTGAKMGG